MNFLPKGQAEVVRDGTNRVIRVVAIWQGKRIPFVLNRQNKVVRADYSDPARLKLPGRDYQRMYRQVVSVFAGNQTKAKAEDLPWLVQGLNDCGVFLKGRGRLEITRWDKKAGKQPKLIRQTVEDIDLAIRMQGHIIDGYSIGSADDPGELDQLESIELVVSQANQVLLNWRQTSATEKLQLQRQLAGVVLRLEYCRNEFKVAARVQAEEILPLKDSLGRPNPGAFAARTVAALNDLTQRIKELNIIMPYIAMRKQLLILADRWLKSKLSQTAGLVTLITRHRVFSSGQIDAHEPKIIMQKLDQALLWLNSAVISPYYQQAKSVQAELKSAKELFRKNNFAGCRQKLHLALELFSATSCDPF